MSNYSDSIFIPDSVNNSWAHLYEYIPENSRVLDIGCSSGNFGQALIEHKHCQVVGLDIDEDDVKLAKTRLTEAYICNIETQQLPNLDTFNVIVMADVIEHLVDPVQALRKVKNLLKDDGRLLFSIPNMAHISIRLMLLEGFFEYTDKWLLDRTHLHYYDEPEVKHVLSEAQFKIEEMHPTTVAYPKEVLTDNLKNMGLTPNDIFYKKLKETKADIFEFVGWASPTNKHTPANRQLKYTFPPDELSQEIIKREQLIKAQTDQIALLTMQIKTAQDELQTVVNSRSWRATIPLRKAAEVSKKLRKS